MIESMLFAGLRPQNPRSSASAPTAKPTPGRNWIQTFISGGAAPNDPLYLSNRTSGQKIRTWALVAVPILVIAVGIGLALTRYLGPPATKPAEDLSPAEIAARTLPHINDVTVDSNRNLDVVDVHIEHAGSVRMVGKVRNRTNRAISHAEIRCDLTDTAGTKLGSVSLRLENIPAAGTKDFTMSVNPDAEVVLVRDIQTR